MSLNKLYGLSFIRSAMIFSAFTSFLQLFAWNEKTLSGHHLGWMLSLIYYSPGITFQKSDGGYSIENWVSSSWKYFRIVEWAVRWFSFCPFILGFLSSDIFNKRRVFNINMKEFWDLNIGNWADHWPVCFPSALEYCLDVEKLNLSAIRTVRVLRPLRAINRIPSKTISHCIGLAFTDSSVRYEDPGHVAPGHPAHAGQRPPPLLLRLLHLRHYRGPAVGGASQAEMLHQRDLPANSDEQGGLQGPAPPLL